MQTQGNNNEEQRDYTEGHRRTKYTQNRDRQEETNQRKARTKEKGRERSLADESFITFSSS
jgi:hypothetical protein